ncbi:hypothetical protein JST56_00875 [Candidatus Dependentiae bacterium]|jgi:hypothetical protein|nr:hypothetical protein [Candidatus Dependentiae bacterium]
MNKISKFLALALVFALASNALFASPVIDTEVRASLKQADQRGHGLHCAYYALWNALCSLTLGKDNRRNADLFKEYLKGWEVIVRQSRLAQSIDNLQVEELDLLVHNLVRTDLLPASHAEQVADGVQAANNVTVFASKNQISQLAQGHGLSLALLARIEKFQADKQPQAFIINTGDARDEKQVGTFHWVTAVLTAYESDSDEAQLGKEYCLTFHDSGYVPDSKKNYKHYKHYCETKKPIAEDIINLFLKEDLGLLKARTLLTQPLGAVAIQCKVLEQCATDWEYVGRLEEAVIALNKILGNEVRDTLIQLGETRIRFGMDFRGKNGWIHPDYPEYLRGEALEDLQGIFMSFRSEAAFDGTLSQPGYAVKPEIVKELAINKLVEAYQQFVVTGQVTKDAFISVAREAGISQEIIDVGIAQVEYPLVVHQDVVAMDTE